MFRLSFFLSLFIDNYNSNAYHCDINKFGFATNDFYDKFEKLNYDTIQINNTFKMDYTFDDRNYFEMNKKIIDQTIKRCTDKGIEVVFITPPFYKTFLNHIPPECKREVEHYVNKMNIKYQTNYFNYSADKRFALFDFKNDNPLNSNGAQNFTKIIK